MKQIVNEMNLSRIFLFILLLSPLINAQVNSKEVQNNDNCPTNTKAWNNYKIDDSNYEKFRECINWLKTQYIMGKELSYMDQQKMQEVLFTKYSAIIAYYKDPNAGFDEEMAEDLQEELNDLKKRKSAKPN